MEILQENTKMKYIKKYKCPYCNKRLSREDLIRHIENIHNDLIPEGYTPTRVVFNVINKKDHGNCVICGNETNWNENLARYDRFDSIKCNKAYVKSMKDRMRKIYGVDNLIYSIDHQKKMLSNRRISGQYKFSDGVVHSYVGSYEKRTLEFLDKVMEYRGIDIVTPGPIIDYEYNGQKHRWILDIYIPSYNLAIDCKDGGSNKNNRDMRVYREKQIAKEKAIAIQNKYNYLRLTDNDFGQLMSILAQLKLSLIENNPDKIISINENMFPYIHSFIQMNNWYGNTSVYIIPYTKDSIFDNIAISDSITYDNIWYKDINNRINKTDKSFLEDASYNVYEYTCNKRDIINKLLVLEANNIIIPDKNIIEIIMDNNMLTKDEWKCYNDIHEIYDMYSYNEICSQITTATIINRKGNIILDEKYNLDNILRIKKDSKGYYIENSITGIRSKSRDTKVFNDIELSIIRGGIL